MDPYRCVGCLSDHDRWRHQCQVCGRSGALVKLATLEEYEPESAPVQRPVKLVRTAADAPDIPEVRVSTGIDGLDRVLGGGMVSPGVILFAGAPGCGKSTILMPMIAGLTTTDRLYVAAEESDVRFRRRAVRCGLSDRLDDIPVLHTQDFNVIMDVIARADPRIVVIDSVNVLVDPVRDVPRDTDNNMLRNVRAFYKDANDNNRVLVLVAQMNKDDGVRGTKELQHLVDTVMLLSKQGARRVLRCPEKNRDGSTDEVAVFLMTKSGLHEQVAEDDDEDGPVADRTDAIGYMSEQDIPIPKAPRRRAASRKKEP
jgi:DNA repair protein RadA/Sms